MESKNPNGTTGYDLQNDVRYYFSRSYMPIAATENEAIFYSPSSYDYYYLDFSNLSGGGGKTAYDYFNEGVTLYNQQKYQDAIAQFDQAISLYSGDERFYLYKGYALYYLGKYQDAITAFDNSLMLTKSEEAYYFKAKSLFELKRYTESRAIILIVISYNNQSPEYYSYLGTILINLGQYQDALDAYNNALRINPSYPEAVAGKDQVEDLINDGGSKQLPSKSNVPLDHTFTINFNTAVNKNTVNSSNVQVYEVSTGQLIPISILSGSNPNAISFKPVTNYKPSNLYRVTVKKDVKSTSGKALTQNVEMTFTTVSQGPVYGEGQKLDEMEELLDESSYILKGDQASEGLKDINFTEYENGFFIGYYDVLIEKYRTGQFLKEYQLGGGYKRFTATVVPSYYFNYKQPENPNDIGRMKIYGDGQLLYDSGIISTSMKTPKQIDINLQGVNRLKIEVKNGVSLGFFNPKLYN
ncbi:tetratricopeptide repeat protein [Ureibacillus xyleni]|uniref:Tetratricopeptide repeat protein n=1 Tax=Ureibacillus xyleni TaxID=614648 RepID=A0A285R9I2_9BACL|nr:tetratricopeptide repeat protein [Ureibacillus xyleni]SOB90750.1 tetratricopeptide repeat protein [Ureibacillus xyleni]